MEKKRCNHCGKEKFAVFFEREGICIKCDKDTRETAKPKKLRVTKEEYELVYSIQGGQCAICKRPANEFKRKLCPDYDSKTGNLRGLLCPGCNSALSQLKERTELVLRLMDYTENNPGNILQNQLKEKLKTNI